MTSSSDQDHDDLTILYDWFMYDNAPGHQVVLEEGSGRIANDEGSGIISNGQALGITGFSLGNLNVEMNNIDWGVLDTAQDSMVVGQMSFTSDSLKPVEVDLDKVWIEPDKDWSLEGTKDISESMQKKFMSALDTIDAEPAQEYKDAGFISGDTEIPEDGQMLNRYQNKE